MQVGEARGVAVPDPHVANPAARAAAAVRAPTAKAGRRQVEVGGGREGGWLVAATASNTRRAGGIGATDAVTEPAAPHGRAREGRRGALGVGQGPGDEDPHGARRDPRAARRSAGRGPGGPLRRCGRCAPPPRRALGRGCDGARPVGR